MSSSIMKTLNCLFADTWPRPNLSSQWRHNHLLDFSCISVSVKCSKFHPLKVLVPLVLLDSPMAGMLTGFDGVPSFLSHIPIRGKIPWKIWTISTAKISFLRRAFFSSIQCAKSTISGKKVAGCNFNSALTTSFNPLRNIPLRYSGSSPLSCPAYSLNCS